MREFGVEEFFLLASAMGSEDAIDLVNRKGQSDVVCDHYLAKNMNPSREYWEKVGFTFDDNDSDQVLIKATLPEGWSLKKEEIYHTYMIDDKNRTRGYMFYKAAFYDRDARMNLYTKYSVRTNYLESGDTEIYFGSKDEKLYVAGIITRGDPIRFTKEEKLREQARLWGKEYYPDYQNPLAYWDDEKNKVKKNS